MRQDPRDEYAILLVEEAQFHKKHMENQNRDMENQNRDMVTEHSCEVLQKFSGLQARTKNFMGRVIANPLYADEVLIWMVDAVGESSCGSPEDIFKNTDGSLESIREGIADLGGDLFKLVRSAINSWGFDISDSGGGCCGWHLGVPCTETESRKLCALLHSEFKNQIDKGWFGVKKWGILRFKEIMNWDDAEEWLKEKGLKIDEKE